MSLYEAWFDGACPGMKTPTYGYIVKKDGQVIARGSGMSFLLNEGRTVNVAEYSGLLSTLYEIRSIVGEGDKVVIRGDSQLVIRQMEGIYKVRCHHLAEYNLSCKILIADMKGRGVRVTLEWIRREKNTEADELSKGVVVR